MKNFAIFFKTIGLPGEPNIDSFIIKADDIKTAYERALACITIFFSLDYSYSIIEIKQI